MPESPLFHASYYEQHFTENDVENALEYYEDYCQREKLPFDIGDDTDHAMDMLKLERDAGEDSMLNMVMYHAIEVMGMENPNEDTDEE